MARVSRATIRRHLETSHRARTTTAQGRALEELVCYVFERVPGISVTRRNRLNAFATEEIDVAFWNEKQPRGFHFLPEILLVECKNWSAPVTSMEVSWFKEKIASRGLDFGILVAAHGYYRRPSRVQPRPQYRRGRSAGAYSARGNHPGRSGAYLRHQPACDSAQGEAV